MTQVGPGCVDNRADYSVTTPDGNPCHRLVKTSLQIVGKEVSYKTMEHSPDSFRFHIHIFMCDARGPEGWVVAYAQWRLLVAML